MIKFVGTALQDKQTLLFYCQKEGNEIFFKAVGSQNGLEFSDKCNYIFVFDESQKEEQNFNWKSFRIARQHDQFLLTYKLDSEKDASLFGALSADLIRWQKIGKIDEIKETGTVVPLFQFNNNYVMYFGEKDIKIASSEDLKTWKTETKAVLKSRKASFDSGNLEVANAYVLNNNILLIYYVKKEKDGKTLYDVGAAIFDKSDPTKPIWRSEEAIFEHPEEMENEKMQPFGSAISGDRLILYWLIGENNLFAVSVPIPTTSTGLKHKVFTHIVKKSEKNPIIGPNPAHPWESRAAFNSAAILDNGKVHFVYRALGDKDLSVLGYAVSSDGVNIDERSTEPIYIPREPFETPGGNAFSSFAQHFASGGGYGGIEDPRITRLEDKIYLTYVAFDGANPPRVAMSSIHIDDFRKKNWDKWEKPKLISAPGMVNKSAVIFPRKIRGKYVMMHRVYPNILIDYLDNLNFKEYLKGHYFIPPRKKFWDSKKVGAGAPPMETNDGWLLIYQSVGHQDSSRYKIGAMMLDRDNPEKVLYRTHTAIIEPSERYENEGFKAGVVYPCGAVIKDNSLHVYYGGADTVVCAAKADLNTFLNEMKRNREPKLTKVTSRQFAN